MKTMHFKVYGIVQGVGFRPFTARLARQHHLTGNVSNHGSFVEIITSGKPTDIENFSARLSSESPPRAHILAIEQEELPFASFESFSIIESTMADSTVFISPDIATCDRCRAELFDKDDRRYLHPFINCTDCGPRLTILESTPYDRERTSMKDFPMCKECSKEYASPESRRYDAQPVCCHACGPHVYLLEDPAISGKEAITHVRRILADGGIAAVKGIGGFHLTCSAMNEGAVRRLRERKNRPHKPFALMMRNLDCVKKYACVSPSMEEMLTGPQKPILLLEKKDESLLAPSIVPGNPKIGIMLPYAPIHMLLFDYPDGIVMPDALVMTSGNASGAPICRTDTEAEKALSPIADTVLSHDRQIRLRADDSVMDWYEDAPYMIRRSRGFSPLPILLPRDIPDGVEVLAMGSELKNTITIGKGKFLYPSPYIGDMTDLHTMASQKDTVAKLKKLLNAKPAIVACDMHPRYHTDPMTDGTRLPVYPIQHHHAHILSCMAENRFMNEVIGIAFDGTGYGLDGTVWGGEIMSASPTSFTRLGSIMPFLQVGGDRSAREGWRIACAMLHQLSGEDYLSLCQKLDFCTKEEANSISFMIQKNLNCIHSTSVGRLFDAVSAMVGICHTSTFEGEAAMALQTTAEVFVESHPDRASHIRNDIGHYEIPPSEQQDEDEDPAFRLPTDRLFATLISMKLEGMTAGEIAYRFHMALARLVTYGAIKARKMTGLSVVALSGGVFQNTLLLRETMAGLRNEHFRILRHSLIPPNDGGISLGQAVAATFHLADEKRRLTENTESEDDHPC